MLQDGKEKEWLSWEWEARHKGREMWDEAHSVGGKRSILGGANSTSWGMSTIRLKNNRVTRVRTNNPPVFYFKNFCLIFIYVYSCMYIYEFYVSMHNILP